MQIPTFDPSMIGFDMPSDEELAIGAKAMFDRVAPYMIDRWPESVSALSFPTIMFPVSADEMRALYERQDDAAWKRNATLLADRLEAVMDWDPYFIRLNSRSPKDVADKLVTCSARQAIDWIANSERCMEDISTANLAGEPIHICLRKPMYMHPDGEVRCFAKDGRLIAVSRYFHRTEPEFRLEPGKTIAAAAAFYDRHLAQFYPEVVFDLYLPGMDGEKLIELNPYGMSDPCLFGSYEEVEKGGERLGSHDDRPSEPAPPPSNGRPEEAAGYDLDRALETRRDFGSLIEDFPVEAEMDLDDRDALARMVLSSGGNTVWDRTAALVRKHGITEVRRGFETVVYRVIEAVEAKIGIKAQGPVGERLSRLEAL